MAGQLIAPVIAEVARLDRTGTAADPDGAGALTSGYDPDYREPIVLPVAGKTTGASARVEAPVIELPCQVEPESFQRQEMAMHGDKARGAVGLVFLASDLEAAGLIDDAGNPVIGPSDRLVRLLSLDGTPIQTFTDPPGMYCYEAVPIGIGLGGTRNLVLAKWRAREQG